MAIAAEETNSGVVIAAALPTLEAKADGYFPLKVNLRHLTPGRRVRVWHPVDEFRAVAEGTGTAEPSFLLDENGVPTTVVSGDASKMTVVPYLKANVIYDSAFITADATPDDQATLKVLEEQGSSSDAPTSDKDGGGCDAGFGGVALLALAGLIATRKNQK